MPRRKALTFLDWLKLNGFTKHYYKLLKIRNDIPAMKKLLKTDVKFAFLQALWKDSEDK